MLSRQVRHAFKLTGHPDEEDSDEAMAGHGRPHLGIGFRSPCRHHAAAPAVARVSPSNADRDFLAGMIPHHQGAIDMARVALRHGQDPKVRQPAEQVIAAQEKEIVMMRE